MSEKNFTHLHVHSGYSLLDGSGKVKDIIAKAKELNMDSIALTDHGVMYGCVNIYKEAKAQGIKAILGCEVYIVPKSMHIKSLDRDNKTYHLVLLVKNEKGYENLMKIASTASIEGFYYKPRIDREFLAKHSEGLIALSACLGGEVQKAIISSNLDGAKEAALFYKSVFGKDFYLELQDHGMEEQKKVNEVNIKLSKELDIPLVATNDVHYIVQGDYKAHDILMCIQSGKTVDDTNRKKYPSDQFYLKSPEEMWELFDYIPEALENTSKIAEECNFDYEFHISKLPKYPLPEGEDDPYEYLVKTCFNGLVERYDIFKDFRGDFNYKDVITFAEDKEEAKELVDRLLYEVGVIKQMGYIDYFLIVWDFIKYAIDNGIPTGPGRGCFLPETKVLLSNGTVKNIEEFKGGEEVVTAYGNYSLVETLLSYDIEEEIVIIEAANETLKLTEDHKVLAIKTSPCIIKQKDSSKLPVICRETCSMNKKSNCIDAPYKNYEKQWIKASELKNNDLILYPIIKGIKKEISYDLLQYCKDDKGICYDNNFLWYEMGSNKLESPKINRYVFGDEDLCKVIGYFIAGGWASVNEDNRTYNVGFAFNLNEKNYVEDIVKLCKKIFNLKGNIYHHKTKHSITVEFNSKIMAKFLQDKCKKGANNKSLPEEFINGASDNQLKVIIGHMFRGDGSYSDIKCNTPSLRIKYTTTSLSLTRQLRMILARLGYWSTIKTRIKKEENQHDEYSVCLSGAQLLDWNNDFKYYQIPIREQEFYRNDGFYKDKDYFYVKIKNVGKESYKGKVYDISVPGDTSYVANSMAVHNSAAGSIVAYTLGITKIDPIKYKLLFERFLNPERVSMPDIDSDFCYERRQEVIDYVVDKYGASNVAQIITFGTMAPRACIRDVGRAMDYSYGEVDRIAKMIPTMLGISIEKALELNPELKTAYDTDVRVKELIDVSRRLEGLPRHSSTHAAGVVIASKPLVEYVPLQKNDESIVTQFDMTTLEELGLLKMDFLGLRTLTVMDDAVKMIKENRGVDIDLDRIDFNDKAVYDMLGEGKTAGVFQLESAGMTSFMKDLKPDCFEDIIAGISLYRPGPMAEIPRYIEGKRNIEKVKYEHEQLEDILNVTYGVMVYQGATRS